jgi:hypothetical protein
MVKSRQETAMAVDLEGAEYGGDSGQYGGGAAQTSSGLALLRRWEWKGEARRERKKVEHTLASQPLTAINHNTQGFPIKHAPIAQHAGIRHNTAHQQCTHNTKRGRRQEEKRSILDLNHRDSRGGRSQKEHYRKL